MEERGARPPRCRFSDMALPCHTWPIGPLLLRSSREKNIVAYGSRAGVVPAVWAVGGRLKGAEETGHRKTTMAQAVTSR